MNRLRFTFAAAAAAMVATLAAAPARAALPAEWTIAHGPRPSDDVGPSALRARVSRVVPIQSAPVVVTLDELPHYAIPEAGPLPEGAGPSYFDAFGRPVDRLDVSPRGGGLYVVPPGGGGRIRVGDLHTFWGNDQPFFRAPADRDRGFGVHLPWNAKIPAELAIFWHGIEASDGGLRFRSAKGTFDRFVGDVVASEWIDSPTRPFVDGLVHAFVSEREAASTVHVVVPTGAVAYASPHAATVSSGDGFFFGGRTPFTELKLPVSSLGATSAGIDVSRFAMERYRAAGASMDGFFDGRIHVSVIGDRPARLVITTTGSS